MLRPFANIATEDQWRRCAYRQTSLESGLVQLAEQEEPPPDAPANAVLETGAGLAFDSHCRLYHSVPERGQIERLFWRVSDRLRPPGAPLPVRDLFELQRAPLLGDFAPTQIEGPLNRPLGLGVDEDDRLWIAEAAARRVRVFDLFEQAQVASYGFPDEPLDIAVNRNTVWALTATQIAEMTARRFMRTIALPQGVVSPTRVAAASSGSLWVLDQGGTASARIVPLRGPIAAFAAPFATDLEFDGDGILVVARSPGASFRRFEFDGPNRAEIAALTGRGYDGRGIVLTPEGRIGFWSATGFRTAVAARRRYVTEGRAITYRLDSGEFSTRWGRVFIDACVPAGTQLEIIPVVADSPPPDPEIPRTPPANMPAVTVHYPEKSPPMPPASVVPSDGSAGQRLHRRETGPEVPWTQAPDDRFETYEAPILATEGRYLWVILKLRGDTRATPIVRAIRAEYPAHDLLRKLPKIFSREPNAESFLWRYLAPIEGMLSDWDTKGALRNVLLDPRSAPAEMLPWLAGFTGLVLDTRWSERARRQAIEQATWLFRFRGTVPGLLRFLEIYLGFGVRIIEQYQLRGHGGGSVGGTAAVSSSILGAGFRVGGAIGEEEAQSISGEAVEDGFKLNAHRFTLFVPGWLTDEQTSVIRQILEVHRPAHTLFDLCSLNAGIRIGRGLYVELTSVVGPTSGWRTWQVGKMPVGREAIVGRGSFGVPVGSAVGDGSRLR